MLKLYPETLPPVAAELAALFKGKAREAAELVLSAECSHDGARACEFAAKLVEEEMRGQQTAYTDAERNAIANFEARDTSRLPDASEHPEVLHKLFFIALLALEYGEGGAGRWLINAPWEARRVAAIYRNRLAEGEAENAA